jgi:predicted methyltransferase MtxX (methanogen marker protein 4)
MMNTWVMGRATKVKEYCMTSELNVPTQIDEDDYVRDGDVILILTVNHSYRFAVNDSYTRQGILSGGALGERQFDATLNSTIQEGNSVNFNVGLHGTAGRIVTSDVTQLFCIRDGQRNSRGFIRFPSFL